MRALSSSFGMRCSAMVRVCSGVSFCFVSGTSLPLMRARNTSPALMCRSDAPRSTAALMIRSIRSVPCLRVDEVAQRLAADVAAPIVEKEIELPRPETARRYRRYVWHDESVRQRPQRACRIQRLTTEDVEHR